MSIGQFLLPEFDMEMENTRKVLERVPEAKFSWQPHEKSWTMLELAVHIANLPTWTNITLEMASFDMAPEDGEPVRAAKLTSRQEILETFKKNVTAARETIAATDDAAFMENWALLSGGKTVFQMPKLPVLRSFVMNHIIHHRAQLTVYLRMNDVPLPAIYGPTADEG